MTKKSLDLHLGFKNEDNLLNTLKLYFDEPDFKKNNQICIDRLL